MESSTEFANITSYIYNQSTATPELCLFKWVAVAYRGAHCETRYATQR